MKKTVLTLLIFALPVLCRGDIVVVINPQNSIAVLDKKALVDIYMGRAKSFGNGLSTEPIDQPKDSELKAQFYKAITGKELAQVNAYWAKLRFSGRHTPPRDDFDNHAEIRQRVAQDKHAIAYLPASEVDESVKVIFSLEANAQRE